MNLFIAILIRIIEVMFVAGVIGSAIVVVLTSVEDFKMLFEKETSPSRKM
jgi:Na+-transporting NADH:ubiquinone oxidoreductase subunit NqrC